VTILPASHQRTLIITRVTITLGARCHPGCGLSDASATTSDTPLARIWKEVQEVCPWFFVLRDLCGVRRPNVNQSSRANSTTKLNLKSLGSRTRREGNNPVPEDAADSDGDDDRNSRDSDSAGRACFSHPSCRGFYFPICLLGAAGTTIVRTADMRRSPNASPACCCFTLARRCITYSTSGAATAAAAPPTVPGVQLRALFDDSVEKSKSKF
jgi:hypothetical protein